MAKIKSIRPVLLSAPYADKDSNAEVQIHLYSGYRTCGMVEITLENGVKGLGEGYLAVFAPMVFKELVQLLIPYVEGRKLNDRRKIMDDLILATGYWSLQGAARHVISAFDIALLDCEARLKNIPVYELLGGKSKPMKLYGSGGDSINAEFMQKEIEYLNNLGIEIFKIRARSNQIQKATWTIDHAKKYNISIAIDMTQNLANPGLGVSEVLEFVNKVISITGKVPYFFEESLGMAFLQHYPQLKSLAPARIAGGEIVTTEDELINRVNNDYYDIVQPDATVIGGIEPVLKVFDAAEKNSVKTIVHCWGGPVGMMANYHAAIARNADMVEWPMPAYGLRNAMIQHPWQIKNGKLTVSDTPGLGVNLNEDLEQKYKFRPEAVYNCIPNKILEYNDKDWS